MSMYGLKTQHEHTKTSLDTANSPNSRACQMCPPDIFSSSLGQMPFRTPSLYHIGHSEN